MPDADTVMEGWTHSLVEMGWDGRWQMRPLSEYQRMVCTADPRTRNYVIERGGFQAWLEEHDEPA